MIRLIIAIALVAGIPATVAAGKYYHGQIITHDESGIPYKGYYFKYNNYTYKFERYDIPTQNIVQNTYIYDYSQRTANQGTTQAGLYPAYRYDQVDVGTAQLPRSDQWVAAGRSVDERTFALEQTRAIQSGYTRDKLAHAQSFALMTDSASKFLNSEGGQVLMQAFAQYSQGGGAVSGQRLSAAAPLSIEARCQRCHANGAQANGVILPLFAQFDAAWAQRAQKYISRIDERNCAKRAQLTPDEQQSLLDFLDEKRQQQPQPQQQPLPPVPQPQTQQQPGT